VNINNMSLLSHVIFHFSAVAAVAGPFAILIIGLSWYKKKPSSKERNLQYLKTILIMFGCVIAAWFITLSYSVACSSEGGHFHNGFRALSCRDQQGEILPIPMNFLGYFFK
jgi:hypothetical protein